MSSTNFLSGIQDFLSNLLYGGYQKIGSASDVTMLNQDQYDSWLSQLNSALGSGTGTFNDLATKASSGYDSVADMSSNYSNYISSLLGDNGLYSSLAKSTNNFDPNAASNAYLSQQSQLASLANQNVGTALSDVYSTGRAQATAAANTARKQAAEQLASAGLLNSGAAVNSMTQATADQIMNMETNLAQARSQAYQNQLSNLQQGSANLLNSGYGNAANLAATAQQLGLSGLNGQTSALSTAAQGQSSLANLYGNLESNISEPTYWQPQYSQNGGLLTLLSSLSSLGSNNLSSAASLLSLLGIA